MQGLFIFGAFVASCLLVLGPMSLFALVVKYDTGPVILSWIAVSILAVIATWYILAEHYWEESE
jgi:hypothetical protein